MPLQDKTEPATPRRRREARQRGQVAKSAEANSAIVLLVSLLTLKYAGPQMLERMGMVTSRYLSSFPKADLTTTSVHAGLVQLLLDMAVVVGPLMAAVFIAGFVANAAQVGLVLSAQPLMPQGSRLDPIGGIARMFSTRSAVELGKAMAKIGVIGYIVFAFIRAEYPTVVGLVGCDPREIASGMGGLIYRLLFKAGMALLVIAAVDYGFQRYQNEKQLRMTKEEVKEDYKRSEGDPLVKSMIRQRQRKMAMSRMMQSVESADVVVTNPTHFAVALKYDSDGMAAPVVVAKGKQLVAQKIKEIAAEHKVPMVENVQLARALYKSVEIGDVVPAALYQAVAEILAYVYRLKNKYSSQTGV